jgi:hypothetical protein
MNLKAAGSFKYAETGWERGLLSRACFCPQHSMPTASRLTRRQGYASWPAVLVVSPWFTFSLALSCGIFQRCESLFLSHTHPLGFRSNRRLQWYIPENSNCEYDNGYLVFDRDPGVGSTQKEVWRLASDFVAEDEVAADAPPNGEQMAMSAYVTELYHHYTPRGQFRPWSLLRFNELVYAYRLVYPALICTSKEHTFLCDVRTGSLMQTINTHLPSFRYPDVNERHAFICEPDAIHVFSRESGIEVLRIPVDATVRCSQRVEDPSLISGDWFTTPLSVSPEVDESPRPVFIKGAFTHTL